MKNEIWLSIEEVCALTEEIKETVRRKCKRGEYSSTFTKNGRFKVYSVLLSSLPLEYQNRYFNKDPQKEMVYYNRVKKLGTIHGFDVDYITPEILNIKDGKCPYADCKCHKKK